MILAGSDIFDHENFHRTETLLTDYSKTPLSSRNIIALIEVRHYTLVIFTSDGEYQIKNIVFEQDPSIIMHYNLN